MRLPDPPILVITDRAQCAEPLELRALALLRGGCRWLSLREKDMDAAARLALLKRLVAIGKEFGATVGVHGDPSAARSCGAALHLPTGGDIAAARRMLGPAALIGQSCHDAADLAAAAAGGADYATLGPVAETASKPGYQPGFSAAALAALAASARLPVLALGGVTTDRATGLVAGGFAGVAVMGEAMRAADPEAWFAGLRDALFRSPSPTREGQGEGVPPRALSLTRERVRDLRTNATFAERALWRHLRVKQIHGVRFRRQFPIGPYIVDFVCLKARLVVEVDGGQHAIDIVYDDARTRWLESQGFAVTRYWNNDVLKSTEGVVEEIVTRTEARLQILGAGGATPSPSPSRVGEGD